MSKEKTSRTPKSLADAISSAQAIVESAIPEIEVVTPVIKEAPAETEYPEAHDLTGIYASGLLPSSNVPAAHTLQAVAVESVAGKPIAVLVDGTGEVLPAPIPYIASPSATPLYTAAEMEKYQALYEAKELARVEELLHKNTQSVYDPTATPQVEEDSAEDDLYGEPMSQAVVAAFPNAGKK